MQFYIKKSYKLRRKHQHNRRKYTLQTWAPFWEAYGWLYGPHSFYSWRIFIFFSGICRCLFWDEGHEDSSAKCVALFVRKVDQIAAWVAFGSRLRLPPSTSSGIMSRNVVQRHCRKVVEVPLLKRQPGIEKARPDGPMASALVTTH